MEKILIKYLIKLNQVFNKKEIENELLKHPEYPSLLSVDDILEKYKFNYNIINVPIEYLEKLPNIFTTYLENELFLIKKVKNYYIIEGEKIKRRIETKELKKVWTGNVIVVDKLPLNIFLVFKNLFLSYILIIFGLLTLIFILYINSNLKINIQSIYYFTTIIGLFLSYEILKIKFLNETSKFCSKSNTKSCNSILKSNINVLGINFSDLPIIFFSTSFVFLTLFNFGYVISIVSLFSLPTILYSIFLQKTVFKQWCSLCLSISFIILINSILLFIDAYNYNLNFVVLFIILLALNTMIWFKIKLILIEYFDNKFINYKFTRIFRNEENFYKINKIIEYNEVFHILKKIPLNENVNKNDKEYTIILSPKCEYCHKKIEESINFVQKNNNIRLNVFYNINPNSNIIYTKIAKTIYKLFNNGGNYKEAILDLHIRRLNPKKWMQKWNVNDDNFDIENKQLENQLYWCIENKFFHAPVVIFDNMVLDNDFGIDDIQYLIK